MLNPTALLVQQRQIVLRHEVAALGRHAVPLCRRPIVPADHQTLFMEHTQPILTVVVSAICRFSVQAHGLRHILVGSGPTKEQGSQIGGRKDVALRRCLPKPGRRRHQVFRSPLCQGVHYAQTVLGCCMPIIRGLGEPTAGGGEIHRDAMAQLIAQAYQILRLPITVAGLYFQRIDGLPLYAAGKHMRGMVVGQGSQDGLGRQNQRRQSGQHRNRNDAATQSAHQSTLGDFSFPFASDTASRSITARP